MILQLYRAALFVPFLVLCSAQENMLSGLWPFTHSSSSTQGSFGSFSPFGYLAPFGLFPFGALGQSREQETPGGFGQYGMFPFGLMGQSGEQGGTEAAAGEQGGTEAATEQAETTASQQSQMFNLGAMLLWNQLLSNQELMPSYNSGSPAQEPGSSPSGRTLNVAETISKDNPGRGPSGNAGQSLSGSSGRSVSDDMSWIPFFMLQ